MGGGTGRLLEPKLDSRLNERLVAADAALIGAGAVTQPAQPLLPVGPDPAVERVAADQPRLAVRAHLLLAGETADEQAPLSAPDPAVERLRDQVIAPQSELFGRVRGHSAPPAWTSRTSKTRPSPPPRARLCWSPAAARR